MRYTENDTWHPVVAVEEESGSIAIEGTRWRAKWFEVLGKGKWCDKGIVEVDGHKLHQWTFIKDGDFPDQNDMTGFKIDHLTEVRANFFTVPNTNFVVMGEWYREGYNDGENGEKIPMMKTYMFFLVDYSDQPPDIIPAAPSSP